MEGDGLYLFLCARLRGSFVRPLRDARVISSCAGSTDSTEITPQQMEAPIDGSVQDTKALGIALYLRILLVE